MTTSDDPLRHPVDTTEVVEVVPRADAEELRLRAARIRKRSQKLIDALGAGHPLVAQAIERADALEHEADRPGEIRLH